MTVRVSRFAATLPAWSGFCWFDAFARSGELHKELAVVADVGKSVEVGKSHSSGGMRVADEEHGDSSAKEEHSDVVGDIMVQGVR